MVFNGKKFKELNVTKDGRLIASIADGEHGIIHKDGYEVELTVEEIGMTFSEAFKIMRSGGKVKLPAWGGYWFWDNDKATIIMHTKDGEDIDIRETKRPEYTFSNVASDEWMIADKENCPELGGAAYFDFSNAIKYLKRGLKVARKGWNGKKQYIQLATCISYTAADGTIVNCDHNDIGNKAIAFIGTAGVQMGWLASQADMLADDWMFAD